MWRWKLHSLLLGLGEPPDLIKQQVSAFLHLFLNVVPFSINRTVWQHKSHLIWCVVFQSTSTETGAAGKKHSFANGQKLGSKFTVPTEKPFVEPFSCALLCTNTQWRTLWTLLHFHVGGEEALSQWKQQSFLCPLAVTICMIVLVCLSNTTMYFFHQIQTPEHGKLQGFQAAKSSC